MPRFKKKPVVVEAVPYEKGMEDGVVVVRLGEVPDELLEAWYGDEVLKDAPSTGPLPPAGGERGEGILSVVDARSQEMDRRINQGSWPVPFIQTSEGRAFIRPTDYIVTGVHDERYPVKKEIFEATYEEDPQGALAKEIELADKHLTKCVQDYQALGRFIMPIRNQLGELSTRWEKGERTLQLCQEIMAVSVPQS